MASPRTVHFQRSFSEVSACEGHLGGPNTRIPEEVTCSTCWEIVKDQARRRGELNLIGDPGFQVRATDESVFLGPTLTETARTVIKNLIQAVQKGPNSLLIQALADAKKFLED
jgi:hypothetical protein